MQLYISETVLLHSALTQRTLTVLFPYNQDCNEEQPSLPAKSCHKKKAASAAGIWYNGIKLIMFQNIVIDLYFLP